jgi:hypothetical protein
LRTSVNSDIQQLYTKTSSENIVTDDIIERAAAGISEQYMLRNAAKKILVRKNLHEIWSNFVELKEKLDNEEEKSNSFQYCAAVLEEAEENKTKVHLWLSEQQKNNVEVEIRPDDSISNVLNQNIKGELRDKFSKWQSKSCCEKGSVRLKQRPFKLGCMNFSSRN